MKSAREPAVSVIVIGYAPPALLQWCLEELRRQCEQRPDVELLVVAQREHQGSPFAPVRSRFPDLPWIEAPDDCNVSRLRGLGIARSQAPVIVLLEGDCIPAKDWVARLVRLHPAGGIGGAIEPGAFRSRLDWAAYFSEFAPFLAPLPPRPPQLPGTNVCYRRGALPAAERLAAEGLFETFVNADLGDAALASDSSLIVYHERQWPTALAVATRFHHGRVFAALRVRGAPLRRRAVFIGLSLLLPAVLFARVMGQLFRRRRFLLQGVLAAPWLAVLSASWAAGELMGYALGAGSSLEKWR